MPEGPEIRRAADRIAAGIAGEVATHVRFGLEPLEVWEPELSGRRVESVTSRGKALLTRFEGGHVLYSHNQLYGRWYVVRPEHPPKTGRQLRVAIETPKRWALLYSASDIDVLAEAELESHPFLDRLGPDLLDTGTTPARIAKRLDDKRFRGRQLGQLLLDQAFLAGVGNYLRSEILYFSGLHPRLRPADLDEEQRKRLAKAARSITRRSYRTGGITEEAPVAKAAKAAGEPRRTYRHAVFGRAGAACRRCAGPVTKLEVASRRLYVCDVCQPLPVRR